LGVHVVHEAIEARREGSRGATADLRTPQVAGPAHTADVPELPDFKLRAFGPPPSFEGGLEDVVLVERLREVSALRGFTRINAADDLGSSGGTIVRLSRDAPRWLPCSEVRGEAILIRFPENTVLEREARYRESGAAHTLREGNRAWRERRGLPSWQPGQTSSPSTSRRHPIRTRCSSGWTVRALLAVWP
jgi:hypothetical protein